MTIAFALIGLAFVVLSLVMLPQLLRRDEQRGAAYGIVGGIWFVAAFGLGSWAVAVTIWGGLEFIDQRIGFGHFVAYFFLALFAWSVGVNIWLRRAKLKQQGAFQVGRKRL